MQSAKAHAEHEFT